MMLSNMEEQETIIKVNNEEFEIGGLEIGIDKNLGKIYIVTKEKD